MAGGGTTGVAVEEIDCGGTVGAGVAAGARLALHRQLGYFVSVAQVAA